MTATGTIAKVKEDQAVIIADVNPYEIEKKRINKCTVIFDDGRRINREQQKKAYAILSDIADFTGDLPEYVKELMKYLYISRYGGEYFSLADCTVTKARDFISLLLRQ